MIPIVLSKNLGTALVLGGMTAVVCHGATLTGTETPKALITVSSNTAVASGNTKAVTYLQDVLPIFMGKCYRCHDNQAKFLHNWLDYNDAFHDRAEIKRRIWDSWNGRYFKQPMPTVNSPEYQGITEEERVLIKDWVESGAPYGVLSAASNHKSKLERIELGKRLFTVVCSACHQPTGQGIPNRFPPLAGSDFLNADKNRAIKVLLQGLQGEVTVNGQKFNNSMPSFPLGDEDIANALTYVYNSFANSGKDVTPEEVKALRAQKDDFKASASQTAGISRPDEKSPWE